MSEDPVTRELDHLRVWIGVLEKKVDKLYGITLLRSLLTGFGIGTPIAGAIGSVLYVILRTQLGRGGP